MEKQINLTPIGIVHSPYKEKFAVPRQPGLVQDGKGILELIEPYNQPDYVRGLEDFSHIWLLFVFDQIKSTECHPTVRPPRLGGNKRVGVFSTRSTHRPNPIGLSKVKLERIEIKQNEVILHLGSLDLVDKTLILDIKPYIQYTDSEPLAQAGFAQEKPVASLQVNFEPQAIESLLKHQTKYPYLQRFISEILAQDPRPAYKQNQKTNQQYGMAILDFNVRWEVKSDNPNIIWVISIDNI